MSKREPRTERHPFVLDCERNYECAFCGFGATHRAHRTPYEIPDAESQVPRCDDPEHTHAPQPYGKVYHEGDKCDECTTVVSMDCAECGATVCIRCWDDGVHDEKCKPGAPQIAGEKTNA